MGIEYRSARVLGHSGRYNNKMLLLFGIFVLLPIWQTFTYANDIFTIKLRCCVVFFFYRSLLSQNAILSEKERRSTDIRWRWSVSSLFSFSLVFFFAIIKSNFPNVQIAKTIIHIRTSMCHLHSTVQHKQ